MKSPCPSTIRAVCHLREHTARGHTARGQDTQPGDTGHTARGHRTHSPDTQPGDTVPLLRTQEHTARGHGTSSRYLFFGHKNTQPGDTVPLLGTALALGDTVPLLDGTSSYACNPSGRVGCELIALSQCFNTFLGFLALDRTDSWCVRLFTSGAQDRGPVGCVPRRTIPPNVAHGLLWTRFRRRCGGSKVAR